MATFTECMDTYKAEFKKLNISFNEDLLTKVAKGLGPSIYNKDAATLAGSDQKEIDTIKNNFLIKKLGLTEKDGLDASIDVIVEQLGRSNRNKYRAIFYYLLVEKYKKQSVYA